MLVEKYNTIISFSTMFLELIFYAFSAALCMSFLRQEQEVKSYIVDARSIIKQNDNENFLHVHTTSAHID